MKTTTGTAGRTVAGVVATAAVALLAWAAAQTPSAKAKFTPPRHAPGVDVVDFASHDLPPVRIGERVADLMSGSHFDDLLQDTPDELRPPSLILFTGHKSCKSPKSAAIEAEFRHLAENVFPARERLLIATYDMDSAPKRAWFKFTPEMDLVQRVGGATCHTLVFVKREANGFLEWCEEKTDDPDFTYAGCDKFKDYLRPDLIEKLDVTRQPEYVPWVTQLIQQEGEPMISPVLRTYANQGRWMLERDETTTDNQLRDYFLVEAFPAFTKRGYEVLPIPPKMYDWMRDFYERRKRERNVEGWHSASTQMSFHETQTTFVSLDQEAYMRDKLANEVIKPILEKWCNLSLELTSFYGIREYKKQSWLRNHIDRIDTHVISVTFSLGKLHPTEDRVLTPDEAKTYPSWPLEVVSWDGRVHRHVHPMGTMALYESSKLIHGRPYHNKGPGHLGAFLHFKPVVASAEKAKLWDDIARAARRNQAQNSVRGPYHSTPSVEPKHPIFSQIKYGENTGFDAGPVDEDAAGGKKKRRARHAGLTARFKNSGDVPLTLKWVSPEGEQVPQGTFAPGSSMEVNTYLGHKFVWVDAKSDEALPQGMFEIEPGRNEYAYRVVKS